jgi:hypothetical protein
VTYDTRQVPSDHDLVVVFEKVELARDSLGILGVACLVALTCDE